MSTAKKILPTAGFLLAPSLIGAGPVIDFFDPTTVRHKAGPGATVAAVESRLRVSGSPSQVEARVAIEPIRGYWDLSFHTDISASLRNLSDSAINVSLRIENEGADERHNAITVSVGIAAGQVAVLAMPLTRPVGHLADGSPLILIGMRSFPWATSRKPAQPKIDPRKAVRIAVTATSAKGPVRFELTALELSGSTVFTPAPGKPLFPLFDEFGQFIHWEWPGKIHSVNDMRRHLEEENADLARHPRPEDWDEYGGWASGPALRATGAFRTQKYRGKWWLVDPNGRLFFSYGPACIQLNGDPTAIERRRNYFAWLPDPTDPRYKEFFSSAEVKDDFDFGTGSVRSFSFAQVNLLRKYGENWREESAELAHRRVASWAMNTMANWSDLEVCRLDRFYPNRHGRTPYTQPVRFRGAPSLRGRQGRSFHDPFHPGFVVALRSGMKELAEPTATTPGALGISSRTRFPGTGRTYFGARSSRRRINPPSRRSFGLSRRSTAAWTD